MQKVTPFLWFDTQAEEAMTFYASVFKRSKVTSVNLRRAGQKRSGVYGGSSSKARIHALNAGPLFTFNEAISLSVACEPAGNRLPLGQA